MIILINLSPSKLSIKNYPKNLSIEPLGLEYIKSNLSENYGCLILDNFLENKSINQLIQIIKEKKPFLIGISFTQFSILEAKKIVTAIKNEKIHITCGGIFPSLSGDYAIKKLNFDSVIIGDGEHTFAELASHLKRGLSLQNISGLIFKCGKKVISNKLYKLDNLDKLNPPVRDLIKFVIPNYPLGISASRGCYWSKCRFCCTAALNKKICGKKWRPRNIKKVVEEINSLNKKFRYNRFSFVDDCFFGGGSNWKKRGYLLSRLINNYSLNIKYSLDCRPEHVDKNLFLSMKKSGLISVYIGVETASQKSLNSLNKGSSLKSIKKAIKICEDVGIELNIGFIPFDYNFNFLEVKKNLLFLKQIKKYQKGLYTNLLVPFYGTDIFKTIISSNQLDSFLFPKLKWKDKRTFRLYTLITEFLSSGNHKDRAILEGFIDKAIQKIEQK